MQVRMLRDMFGADRTLYVSGQTYDLADALALSFIGVGAAVDVGTEREDQQGTTVVDRLTAAQVAAGATGVAALTASGGICSPTGESRQLSASRYKKWRAAAAAVRNGTANAKILCIGDSTTAGAGANGVGFAAGGYPKSLIPKLSSALNRAYLPTQYHGSIGTGNIGTVALLAFDTRWTAGAGWSAVAVSGDVLGKTFWSNSTTTNTLTFTPTEAVDTYIVYYGRASASGTFSVAFGGGTATNISSSNATNLLASTTVTGALGVTPLNIARVSGTNLILGVRAYNSTASTIEVINAGGSGAVAADYDGTANPWDAPNMIQNGIVPGLTIYTVGINDWVNATNIDAYEASVRVTLTAAQAVGDVIIVIPAPSAVSAAPAATQAIYIQRLYSIGASLGIDVLDLSQRWISQEDGLADGFYVDTLHPSGLGYSDWAQLLANRIMNL